MTHRFAAAVASSWLLFACASPDDDSWAGAAGDEIDDGEGGEGGSKNSTTKAGGTTVAQTTATTVTHGATTANTTAVTTGSGGCDVGSCESCQGCALNPGGQCAPLVDACFADPDCYALVECLQSCVDEVCANQCANTYPNGMNGYIAVSNCVFCDACPVTCGAC